MTCVMDNSMGDLFFAAVGVQYVLIDVSEASRYRIITNLMSAW